MLIRRHSRVIDDLGEKYGKLHDLSPSHPDKTQIRLNSPQGLGMCGGIESSTPRPCLAWPSAVQNRGKNSCACTHVDRVPYINAYHGKGSDLPPLTLPVTLPIAVKKHPIPPDSTQLCDSGIYLISQVFTAI
jgi:hypothetical protein